MSSLPGLRPELEAAKDFSHSLRVVRKVVEWTVRAVRLGVSVS